MRKLLSICILLVGVTFTSAEPPTTPKIPTSSPSSKDEYVVPNQTIKGLEKPVAIGDVVTLSLSKVDTVSPLVSYDEVWKVYEFVTIDGKTKVINKTTESYTNAEGNKVVVFGSGTSSRTLFVQVAVTYLYATKDSDKITKFGSRTVVLTGELCIGDGTDPQPPPTPEVPDGKFGLTKLVYQSMMNNVKNGRVLAGKKVAVGYDSVVAKIRAKNLTDPEEILQEAGKAASTALMGVDYDKQGWSKVSDDVQNKLFDLYTNKTLKVSNDYADALESLSAGLKLVR